jgi:alanyl-tRNA synthetase
LPDTELSRADLDRIEEMANQIVYENRIVKSYFIPAEKIDTVPLRRPPKVDGEIRIVEIDGFDYSACGGTHCPQTGMIGAIKIIRTERINQKLRIHFVAGLQAMGYFSQYQEIATTLAAEMSTHPLEVIDLVRRQIAQLQDSQKELEKLRSAYSVFEAQDLIAQADLQGAIRLVAHTYEYRPANELRTLGNVLKAEPDLVALLATYDGEKLVLLVTCGEHTGLQARQLLNQQLAFINGRGGGDERIAQGGGIASPAQFAEIFADIKIMR